MRDDGDAGSVRREEAPEPGIRWGKLARVGFEPGYLYREMKRMTSDEEWASEEHPIVNVRGMVTFIEGCRLSSYACLAYSLLS
ncbi:hypothetical protein CMI48_01370 [Candidatus Pacearchaeota archaeon]|jgi:hypothetical protein|nr:hypothetical protein [Candidatus Pacearchaeota archaeon]|tara:strand:+ start:55 stop:303 length:249 start_codon:yes stop_codon:yes gene_type:complete